MHWYLIHTKPRQETCALQNLERQGYDCYLPRLPTEKLRKGAIAVSDEPLFPRYLFIRLGLGDTSRSWAPIRSTRGVSRLVRFGLEPARIDDDLVAQLRAREAALRVKPEPLFAHGERVQLTAAPFLGIEGVFQMAEGERRALVLIEILSKPVAVRVAPASLRKVGA